MGSPAFGGGAIFCYETFHRGARGERRGIHFSALLEVAAYACGSAIAKNDEVDLTGYPPGLCAGVQPFSSLRSRRTLRQILPSL